MRLPARAPLLFRLRSNCAGAVFVESIFVFLFAIAIVFTLFSVGLWLRETDIVTEAARHAARSLAAYTVVNNSCLGGAGSPALTSGECSALGAPANPPQVATVAIGSACEYLNQAGLNKDDFSVDVSPVENQFLGDYKATDYNFTDNPPRTLFSVRVTVSRDPTSSACTFCKFAALATTRATVTFPVNPYKAFDEYQQCDP